MLLHLYFVITIVSHIVIGHTEYTSWYEIMCATGDTESTSCHIIMYAVNIYARVIYKNMYVNIINYDLYQQFAHQYIIVCRL